MCYCSLRERRITLVVDVSYGSGTLHISRHVCDDARGDTDGGTPGKSVTKGLKRRVILVDLSKILLGIRV